MSTKKPVGVGVTTNRPPSLVRQPSSSRSQSISQSRSQPIIQPRPAQQRRQAPPSEAKKATIASPSVTSRKSSSRALTATNASASSTVSVSLPPPTPTSPILSKASPLLQVPIASNVPDLSIQQMSPKRISPRTISPRTISPRSQAKPGELPPPAPPSIPTLPSQLFLRMPSTSKSSQITNDSSELDEELLVHLSHLPPKRSAVLLFHQMILNQQQLQTASSDTNDEGSPTQRTSERPQFSRVPTLDVDADAVMSARGDPVRFFSSSTDILDDVALNSISSDHFPFGPSCGFDQSQLQEAAANVASQHRSMGTLSNGVDAPPVVEQRPPLLHKASLRTSPHMFSSQFSQRDSPSPPTSRSASPEMASSSSNNLSPSSPLISFFHLPMPPVLVANTDSPAPPTLLSLPSMWSSFQGRSLTRSDSISDELSPEMWSAHKFSHLCNVAHLPRFVQLSGSSHSFQPTCITTITHVFFTVNFTFCHCTSPHLWRERRSRLLWANACPCAFSPSCLTKLD